MGKKLTVSIVIRTLNEARYLPEIFNSITRQDLKFFEIEVVIVDSGSIDGTLEIAKNNSATITHIKKNDFSFGRSLNYGCKVAKGDILVFISGHCVPRDSCWLENLIKPIINGKCAYTYGKQEAKDTTKFSEAQLFKKFYPNKSSIPQEGFFCNNANSAISKEIWQKYYFDEELTGCEDMFLAKQLVADGYDIGYVHDASVFHIHNETWKQVQTRYERESIALQKIMPEIQLSVSDVGVFFFKALWQDCIVALKEKRLVKNLGQIIKFRYCQYSGSFKGNHSLKKTSKKNKIKYYYP